jgi:membrane protein
LRTSFQWSLFREAGAQWLTHNPSRLGASLAYYAVLSLAPVLVLAVAICGTVFGDAAARGQVYEQIKDVVGPQAAAVAQSVLTAAHKPGAGLLASITGFVVLLFGASGVFSELRDILNLIWDAPSPGPTTVRSFLKYRALSFLMVTAVGIIIMVTLALSTVLEAVGRYITFSPGIAETANAIGSFLVFSLLFAMVYKAVPDVPIDWQDVAFGGVMTAALFVVGRFFLTLYLSHASVGSPYGAAGSLIVLLVWVYYSSQIFLYGAEFTCVYARRRGSKATKRASMNVEAARSGLRSDAP